MALVQAPTRNARAARVGRRDRRALPAGRGPLVRRLRARSTTASASSWSTPAPSPSSTRRSAPGSYWAHSDPSDVARVEDRTFICSERARSTPAPPTTGGTPPRCGPSSTSCSAAAMRAAPCTSCRSAWARSARRSSYIGVEITDSPYVAVSMRTMTRAGPGRARRARRRRRVRALRALGRRAARRPGEADVPWPCNADEKWIVHFPETREIWSYGSGYGGNALLGKKCFALRIASVIARDEGWLAEHMLVLEDHEPRRPREATSPRRSRRRAARPTSPCSSRPSRAGRSRPSATTSRG